MYRHIKFQGKFSYAPESQLPALPLFPREINGLLIRPIISVLFALGDSGKLSLL